MKWIYGWLKVQQLDPILLLMVSKFALVAAYDHASPRLKSLFPPAAARSAANRQR